MSQLYGVNEMNRLIKIITATLILGACGASIAWFLGRLPSADVRVAKMIDSCEIAHHLKKQRDRLDTHNGITFSFCAWLPPAWADRDGYSEIIVRTVPGPGLSEASDANEADYIKIPCHTVQLTYDFESQGDFEHQPPFTANAGDVLAEDGPLPTDASQSPATANAGDVLPSQYRSKLSSYPLRDEVVYLHNDKQGLYSASCVS